MSTAEPGLGRYPFGVQVTLTLAPMTCALALTLGALCSLRSAASRPAHPGSAARITPAQQARQP